MLRPMPHLHFSTGAFLPFVAGAGLVFVLSSLPSPDLSPVVAAAGAGSGFPESVAEDERA